MERALERIATNEGFLLGMDHYTKTDIVAENGDIVALNKETKVLAEFPAATLVTADMETFAMEAGDIVWTNRFDDEDALF